METPIKRLEHVPPKKLKPNPENPRVHPESAITKMREAIEFYGFVNPILALEDYRMIAGHRRLKAVKKMTDGDDEVPVIILDMSMEEARGYMIADNRLNKDSEWDEKQLKESLENLDIDDTDMGFDKNELQELIDYVDHEDVKDEPVPEEPEEPVTEAGDLWVLGDHRLLCGDATDEGDVERLMDGEEADMVFTDPPYGLGGYGGRNDMDLEGDDENVGKFYNAVPILSETYIWGNYENLLKDVPPPEEVIIWVKNNFGLGTGYRGQKELCFYYGSFDGSDSDVWEVDKDTEYDHPTQKPVQLPARAMKNSSKMSEKVLDLFCGSGSTLIAAEQLDRKCFGMEIDPHYCDVIVERWENMTGKEAKRNP